VNQSGFHRRFALFKEPSGLLFADLAFATLHPASHAATAGILTGCFKITAGYHLLSRKFNAELFTIY